MTPSSAPRAPLQEVLARWVWVIPPLAFLAVNIGAAANFAVDRGAFFRIVGDVYQFNTIYLPAILLACVALAVLLGPGPLRMSRGSIVSVAVALALFGTRAWATHIEPRLLQVRTVVIPSTKVRHPIRIVHVSDIQSDHVGDYENDVMDTIQGLEPDLVINTGDLLHPVAPATYDSELPRIDAALRRVQTPLGFFTVLGDTDSPIRSALERGVGDMQYLHDEETEVRVDNTRLRIFGLSADHSHSPSSAGPMVRAWLGNVDARDLTILAGHAPDYMLGTQELPIDLQLAGHTHGGQVRIPFMGPIVTLSHVPRAWARGFHQVGRTHLNISAGVGAEHAAGLPSIRLFCPPEVTLIELVPARGADVPLPR